MRTWDKYIGAVVNDCYRIERCLGHGGMGTVYQADQEVISRKVAIKILNIKYLGNERAVKRFEQEARLAGTIDSDNICDVTDFGVLDDGAPYIVMPLLKGCSLGKLLKTEGPLSDLRLCDIAGQTLTALEAAHNAGIVHRDIKSDNIFVTSIGDRHDFVKLLDFGISKVLEGDEDSELTHTDAVLGTPFYMSPEQARGTKTVGPGTDIYSMGVVLYEAATGTRPYTGDSRNEIIAKILTESFVIPSKLNDNVSAQLEKVIIKALQKDPADRYQSAAQMREALKSVIINGGSGIEEEMGSTSIHTSTTEDTLATRKPASFEKRINRTWFVAGVGLVLILGVLGIWWALQPPENTVESESFRDVESNVIHERIPSSKPVPKPKIRDTKPENLLPKAPIQPESQAQPQSAPAVEQPLTAEQFKPKRTKIGPKKTKKSVKGRFGTELSVDYDE